MLQLTPVFGSIYGTHVFIPGRYVGDVVSAVDDVQRSQVHLTGALQIRLIAGWFYVVGRAMQSSSTARWSEEAIRIQMHL